MLASSCVLSTPGANGLSVTVKLPAELGYKVVPHATVEPASCAAVIVAALLLQLVPIPPLPARLVSSLTTTEVGLEPVAVYVVKSRVTPRFTRPFGVTRQEQQATSCSSGEKA
jgi:hypothetical protein